MKKILIIFSITFALGGCAQLTQFKNTVENAVVATTNITPQQIYIAANSFDAVKISATNYLKLKRCPQNAPFCREPKVTPTIINLIRAGTIARNNAVTWARANPDGFADQSLYDRLTSITSTLEDMMRQYHVGGQ